METVIPVALAEHWFVVRKTRNYPASDTHHNGGRKPCACVTLYTNCLLVSCQRSMHEENSVLENVVISVSSLVTCYF